MNKLFIAFIGLLLFAGMASAVPVKITLDGEAYGHHGACSGWNSCGNAETCALWACQLNGFNTLISYGAEKPCTQFNNCELFNNQLSVQCNWGNWCDVMGVTDIWCDDGSYTGVCNADIPPQDGEPNVPEFGVVAAGVALIGAVAIFAFKRK